MDKHRDDKERELAEGPGLNGPDYFSLVIEWDDSAEASRAQGQTGDVVVARHPESESEDEAAGSWDVVDEASFESFPASDPPAWGSSVAAASADTAAECEPVVQAIDDQRLAARLGKIAFAVAALGAVLHWIKHLRRQSSLRFS